MFSWAAMLSKFISRFVQGYEIDYEVEDGLFCQDMTGDVGYKELVEIFEEESIRLSHRPNKAAAATNETHPRGRIKKWPRGGKHSAKFIVTR